VNIIKRIPWWGWGLIVSVIGAITNAYNATTVYGTNVYLIDIAVGAAAGAIIWVPLAGLIAFIHNRVWSRGKA